MKRDDGIAVSDFEPVGSIIRRLLLAIVAELPPRERADAIEALGGHGLNCTTETVTAAAGRSSS